MWTIYLSALLFCMSAQAGDNVTVTTYEGKHAQLECPGYDHHYRNRQLWWSIRGQDGQTDTFASRDQNSARVRLTTDRDRTYLNEDGSLFIDQTQLTDADTYFCTIYGLESQSVILEVRNCQDINSDLCHKGVQNAEHNCYKPDFFEPCCSTCEAYRTRIALDIPGCEYGDHMDNCFPKDCVSGDNSLDCCHTCAGSDTSGTMKTMTDTGINGLYSTSLHGEEKDTVVGVDDGEADSDKLALIVGISVGAATLVVLTVILVVLCIQCRGEKNKKQHGEQHLGVTYDAVQSSDANTDPQQLDLEENLLYDQGDQLPSQSGSTENPLYDQIDQLRTQDDAVVYAQPMRAAASPRNGNEVQYADVSFGQNGSPVPIMPADREVQQYENFRPTNEPSAIVPNDRQDSHYYNVMPSNGSSAIVPTNRTINHYENAAPVKASSPIMRANRDQHQYANVRPTIGVEGLVYADLNLPPASTSIPQRTDGVTYSDVKPTSQGSGDDPPRDKPLFSVVV